MVPLGFRIGYGRSGFSTFMHNTVCRLNYYGPLTSNSASIHPFGALDPCSLYTFSLLCSMKQNNLIALHSLSQLCLISTSVVLNSKVVMLHFTLITPSMHRNIGGYGVLHVEDLKFYGMMIALYIGSGFPYSTKQLSCEQNYETRMCTLYSYMYYGSNHS